MIKVIDRDTDKTNVMSLLTWPHTFYIVSLDKYGLGNNLEIYTNSDKIVIGAASCRNATISSDYIIKYSEETVNDVKICLDLDKVV